jgi:hypothetical protein
MRLIQCPRQARSRARGKLTEDDRIADQRPELFVGKHLNFANVPILCSRIEVNDQISGEYPPIKQHNMLIHSDLRGYILSVFRSVSVCSGTRLVAERIERVSVHADEDKIHGMRGSKRGPGPPGEHFAFITTDTRSGLKSIEVEHSLVQCQTPLLMGWIIMIKRALLLLAAASIYVWARRQQGIMTPAKKDERNPESEWANEGGRNPSASV